jgi:hypothetical protein
MPVSKRFRPRGPGRFLDAGFLSLWLCVWLAGEIAALWFLVTGLYALVTGQPLPGSDQPIRLGPALAIGVFLLIWLAVWTLGGILAIREWLRALSSEDLLCLDGESLTRSRRLGPFTFTRQWSHADIHRVFVQPTGSCRETLMAQVGPAVVELTDLGTPEERHAAAEALRTALGLPVDDHPTGPASLPSDWQEMMDPYGVRLLVPNLRTRRQQALIVGIFAGVIWTGLVVLAWASYRSDPNLWVLTCMVSVPAAWLTRQALWLHRGRNEWRIERGRIVRQRRSGASVTPVAEARALELMEETDSDGDRWYELRATRLSAPVDTLRAPTRAIPRHISVHRVIHDAAEARCLGLWLAQRASVPLQDQVPTDASRQAEFDRLRTQLAASGRFGRWMARFLDRVAKRRERR